jgi:CRISPR/Cas system-associated protein Cas10 (large subunit of type III CRISPR-Cas system)
MSGKSVGSMVAAERSRKKKRYSRPTMLNPDTELHINRAEYKCKVCGKKYWFVFRICPDCGGVQDGN